MDETPRQWRCVSSYTFAHSPPPIFFLQFQNLLAELAQCADRFLEEASKYGEVSNTHYYRYYRSLDQEGHVPSYSDSNLQEPPWSIFVSRWWMQLLKFTEVDRLVRPLFGAKFGAPTTDSPTPFTLTRSVVMVAVTLFFVCEWVCSSDCSWCSICRSCPGWLLWLSLWKLS